MCRANLDARAREATLQMITAALVAILDGDTGPMTEVTRELDHTVLAKEQIPFLLAMGRHHSEAMARLVRVVANHLEVDPRDLWRAVATDMSAVRSGDTE